MTMDIGGGFGFGNPMMNSMNSGMSGNQFQYFKAKYGCEDCFRTQPYEYEFPKPRLHQPQNFIKPNFLQRLKIKIFGE